MGLVKDMFVRVNGLTFLVDFYVLNMDVNSASSACDLFVLLGRPFLKTAKAVIDVDKGSLTLRHKEKCDFFLTLPPLLILHSLVVFFFRIWMMKLNTIKHNDCKILCYLEVVRIYLFIVFLV